MSNNVLSTVHDYVLSLEQQLLAITYALLGASAGLLTGSFKATKQLQGNFTSTDGIRDLIYGSAHKDEKDRHSVSDLLKSWVPGFAKTNAPVKQIEAPKENGVADHIHTNGAPPALTGASVAPIAPPDKTKTPFYSPVEHKHPETFPIRHITTNTEEHEFQQQAYQPYPGGDHSHSRSSSFTYTDDSTSGGTPTAHSGHSVTSDLAPGDAGAAHEGHRKKAKKKVKKALQKVKKAFKKLGHSSTDETPEGTAVAGK